ncbi:hypothetical protein ncot_16220 [Nocardioides sp. JQ2195]|uniref:hypothetical protein n=1 Tax=Nocardioides sp. JQ2195 TaxID=2592334 RepID=UPI00143ED676|nr:hypothetical protein [Nocardioides sp. JQ2195]QIX27962.1 hypothetical protein ncot_16220 [Nocardioides sp. JQ2195]
MLLESTVALAIRGRGLREYSPSAELLVSAGGDEVPRLIAAGDVEPGDYVGVRYGGAWASEPAVLPRPVDRPLRGREKAIRIPKTLTDDLALFLGAYFSEGHRNLCNWTVVITNSVDSVLERVQQACFATFGLQGQIIHQNGKCPGFNVASKRLVEFLALLGCGGRASEKRVPPVIAASTRERVLTFLQGAALDAYTCTTGLPRWAICLDSSDAIDELQDLVTVKSRVVV